MAVPELTMTVDGFEQQFGVNYLAHYTLTALLLPTLMQSSVPTFNSRVISLTSSGHGFSSIHFDDVNLTHDYHPWVAYGQSKTANIWLANYLDRVYGPRGVHANAVHPGAIQTPLLQHVPLEVTQQWADDKEFTSLLKSPEQGAATSVWAAVADVWEGKGGKYLADCGIGKPAKNSTDMKDEGFAAHAYDIEGEDKLWDLSARLTGINIA
jgi:NAD(P)-dependent dehydrogenase (short-subunit alcohol dehydrogenase family)